jgi:BRCA1-associated protein
MFRYHLKCILYTPENTHFSTHLFDDDILHVNNTESIAYFKSYPHPKVTQKSNLPRKLSTNTHQNTPPTPIDTPKSQHLNHSLEDKIDFRFGPIELQVVNTTEKMIPLGYGVLHLYRDRQAMQEQDLPDTKIAKQESMKEEDDSDDDRIICILAVPSYMTNKDFMQFLGSSTNKDILQYRFIRYSTEYS